MQLTSVLLASSMALMAQAVPHSHNHARLHEKRGANSFPIHITNNCGSDKSFALYEITPAFDMNQLSDPRVIPTGETHILHAPFDGIGLRLSGNADWPIGDQWNPQGLVEFGYSAWNGMDGTAYDLSFMEGSDPSIGISVSPHNKECEPKSCSPLTCALNEAWTSASQVTDGSPADTVCYHGKTGFAVTWCASE